MNEYEKTPYETNPVESHADALCAFVEAYDVLQSVLAELGEEDEHAFADTLRAAMYRPVSPEGNNRASVSLYEVGVVYFPEEAKYDVNRRKMKAALRSRECDVRALFVQENGILPQLCEMLSEFTDGEPQELIYAAAIRFLNECRRLTAMWA